MMNLALFGNNILRAAIQHNLVSFPSQIPVFVKRGDIQERIVQLYFVRGWQLKTICGRYGLTKSTVRKLLSEWKSRAVAAGYIQEIHPELIAILAREEDVRQRAAFERPAPESHFTTFIVRTENGSIPSARSCA